MKLYRVLTEGNLARSRAEAERLIKQGAVSIGGCLPSCSFFSTGRCSCNGWDKANNPGEEVEAGLAVKVGNGLWRVVQRTDGRSGFDQLNGITRVPNVVPNIGA